jgi:hypothetical protein
VESKRWCFKCGDKFHLGHKYSKIVPLKYDSGRWVTLQDSLEPDSDISPATSDDESLLKLFAHATAGTVQVYDITGHNQREASLNISGLS